MSQAYLYALALAPHPLIRAALAEAPTVTDKPLQVLSQGDIALILAEHDGGEILQTRKAMRAHARVTEALLGVGPVLPMRFGVVADSRDAAAQMVRANTAQIRAEAARLAGKVELGLRVSFPREAALEAMLAAAPEIVLARDRLQGRGAEAHFARVDLGRRVAETLDRRRTQAQSDLLARVAPLCDDHIVKAPEEDVEVLRLECLVPAAAQESFASAVSKAAGGLTFAPGAEPMVHLVGPSAAYHFVRLDLFPTSSDAAA